MIQSIPRFESSDGKPLRYEDEFYKNKLHNALSNKDIICLARGEGRASVLLDFVFHPEILFDWGQKSVHAYLEKKDDRLRRFCDPGMVDKELLIEYVLKYGEQLKHKYRSYIFFKCSMKDVDFFEEQLIKDIKKESDEEKLLCIKEALFYAFHTAQIKEFSKITPCISCSYGNERFKTAEKFGKGHYNKYYVVMDCWVNIDEEGTAYKSVKYVNQMLKQYGLDWFRDNNREIMLKYGIFPQQLVGYYFWDRGSLQKYVINRHYAEEWERNPNFEIGIPMYFDQFIDFEKLSPYNTVYEYNGTRFSIAGRRN